MAPAPSRYHQDISWNIEFLILQWIEAGGGGRIYNAPFDVYLDEVNVFHPDLVDIRPENSGILTDISAGAHPIWSWRFSALAPDALISGQRRKYLLGTA